MSKIHTLKTEYLKLVPQDSLRARVNGIIKRERRAARLRRISAAAAALLITVTLVFNLSPALVAAVIDIPVIGNIVRVITFSRYEAEDTNYKADITTPHIEGLLDDELQSRLNADFSEHALSLILEFENGVRETQDLFGDDNIHMSLISDYAVKTDNDAVLSLDTFIYSEINNFVLHSYYTIDKKNGRLVELPDLFEPGADYVTPLSAYIMAEMVRINEDEGGAFDIGNENPDLNFKEISPEQHFYINDSGELVICFEKYEVAAGFMGSPEFVIPRDIVADIAASELIAEVF